MCDHMWILDKTEEETYMTFHTGRTFFKKRIHIFHGTGTPNVFEVCEKWYCSLCRTRDDRVHTIRTFDEVLEQGYAIFDWRNNEWLKPEVTTSQFGNHYNI